MVYTPNEWDGWTGRKALIRKLLRIEEGIVNAGGATPEQLAEAIDTFFIENPGALAPTWSQVSSKPSTFPPSPHTHPIDELATVGGTASALTFLRGDGEWAEPAGGGEEYAPATRTHIYMAEEMLPATPVLISGNPLTFEFIANGVGPREGHDYVTIQYQDTEVPERIFTDRRHGKRCVLQALFMLLCRDRDLSERAVLCEHRNAPERTSNGE